ncbi:MAG: DUF4097 domain-containing protein [Tannerella sp.]|jgi:hypothetical protein|nr:DUF4097 domain-containing protein [Tannerella sp.]
MRQLFFISAVIITMLAASITEASSSPFLDIFNLSEHKREIRKEFDVGSAPSLKISNQFGNITIREGVEGKITFQITITGKGNSSEVAKENAESVDIDFSQNGDAVSSKTSLRKNMKCNNCSRSIDVIVTVPKKTKHTLKNEYGDINIDRSSEPFEAEVKFGKFFANELVTAKLDIEYGGATVNKCETLILKSSFSKYNLGEIGLLEAKVAYDGLNIEAVKQVSISSEFTNITVENLSDYFIAKEYSYGTLKIEEISIEFSKIVIDASFAKLSIGLKERHDFKAVLHTEFGKIKTGDVEFLDKTMLKKDVVVATAGKNSNPKALVEISSSFGDIVFD